MISGHRGVAGGEIGAVTAIQLAGSFANANVHFHTLVPEGVWHELPDGSLGFQRASFTSLEDLLTRVAKFIDYFNDVLAKPFRWTYTGRPRSSMTDRNLSRAHLAVPVGQPDTTAGPSTTGISR